MDNITGLMKKVKIPEKIRRAADRPETVWKIYLRKGFTILQ